MNLLEHLRHHLAGGSALAPLALVGVASGLAAGAAIIAFRLLTESFHAHFEIMPHGEAFEALSPGARIALAVGGGLLVGSVFQLAQVKARQVGIVHVMESLALHAGRLPWRNAVLQFFGAAVAVVSGHSVGREGPVVHIGAACSSGLGQLLGLPNNSLRILVACGCAAAIAASFNTPLAGVIFAMEVVLMEYTIVGFTPVIIAAVVGASLTHAVFGADTAFNVPAVHMESLWELPYIAFVGFALGALSAAFIHATRTIDVRSKTIPLAMRMGLAGLVTGLCAVEVPQVMGLGYDTVEATLVGEIGLQVLLLVGGVKLIATVACVGMGVPGGLIGPSLVIGATVGGALGILGHDLFPEHSAGPGLYALLGMGAMMAATLQAPLAALVAVLELTGNPNSILPAMIAVVSATLTSRVLFKQDSVFVSILRARGLEYQFDPVAAALGRTGIRAAMSRSFVTVHSPRLDAEQREALHTHNPDWILVAEDNKVTGVAPGDILGFQDTHEPPPAIVDIGANTKTETQLTAVRLRATLKEALDCLDENSSDVALVSRDETFHVSHIYGVITRQEIEAWVRCGTTR